MNKYTYEAVQFLSWKLKEMFDDVYDYYKDDLESISFKVRPNYGYSKFYLDWVEGSYDMSLQALIHFMLYEHKYFKKILSKETYKNVDSFMKQNPEGLYDFGDNEEEQELIDEVEFLLICYMKCLFELKELDSTIFESAGYSLEPTLKNISRSSVINGYVVSGAFFYEVESYLKTNELLDEDKKDLFKIIEHIYNVKDLLELSRFIFDVSKDLATSSIKKAIEIASKNSEYTQIAIMVKEVFCDDTWANEIKSLKK